MLDDRPALRERLLATAAFAAIALGTLAALDFLVTGGFDIGARRSASSYGEPLIGASSPTLAAEPVSTVTAVAWTDPEGIEETEQELAPEELLDAAATFAPEETLAGEYRLYSNIAQLYLEEDARADEENAAVESGDIFYDARNLMPNARESE